MDALLGKEISFPFCRRYVFRDHVGAISRSRKQAGDLSNAFVHREHVVLFEGRPTQYLFTKFGTLVIRVPPGAPQADDIAGVVFGRDHRPNLSRLVRFKCGVLFTRLIQEWQVVSNTETLEIQALLRRWIANSNSLVYSAPEVQLRIDSIVLNADQYRAVYLRNAMAAMLVAEESQSDTPTLEEPGISLLDHWQVTTRKDSPAENELVQLAYFCNVLPQQVGDYFAQRRSGKTNPSTPATARPPTAAVEGLARRLAAALTPPTAPKLTPLVGSKFQANFSPNFYPRWSWKTKEFNYFRMPSEAPTPIVINDANGGTANGTTTPPASREPPYRVCIAPLTKVPSGSAQMVPNRVSSPPPAHSGVTQSSSVHSNPAETPSAKLAAPVAAAADGFVVDSEEAIAAKKHQRRLSQIEERKAAAKLAGEDVPLPDLPYIVALPSIATSVSGATTTSSTSSSTAATRGRGRPRKNLSPAAPEEKFIDASIAPVLPPRTLSNEDKLAFAAIVSGFSSHDTPLERGVQSATEALVAHSLPAPVQIPPAFIPSVPFGSLGSSSRKQHRPVQSAIVSVNMFKDPVVPSALEAPYGLRKREDKRGPRKASGPTVAETSSPLDASRERKRNRPEESSWPDPPHPKRSKSDGDGVYIVRTTPPPKLSPARHRTIVDAVMERQIQEQSRERNERVGFSSYGSNILTTKIAPPPLTEDERLSYQEDVKANARALLARSNIDPTQQRGITRLWLKHIIPKIRSPKR